MNKNTKNILSLIAKSIIFIVLTIGNAFLCALILFIGSITYKGEALQINAIVFFIFGTLFLFISIFIKKLSIKIKMALWIGLFASMFLISRFYPYKSYQFNSSSYTRLNEQDFDVRAYKPFQEESKVALLTEPATLKLETELPILDGARALYPVYAAFAQAVYPSKEYNLHASEVSYYNTIDAYKRLVDRKVDMIFVVAPSKSQLEYAKQAQVEMKFTPIGKDAFVFFVNTKNPVNGLTSQQLKDIYAGKITNWQEVGGNNEEIRAFQRNHDSGSQSAFLNFMQPTPIMAPPKEDVIQGMGGIIRQTANYANFPNAIGFSFRFFSQTMVANDEIKLLSIDGVYPTKETIRSGQYPLNANFFAATLTDNPSANTQKLLEWILSPQGQYLVEETGYVAID